MFLTNKDGRVPVLRSCHVSDVPRDTDFSFCGNDVAVEPEQPRRTNEDFQKFLRMKEKMSPKSNERSTFGWSPVTSGVTSPTMSPSPRASISSQDWEKLHCHNDGSLSRISEEDKNASVAFHPCQMSPKSSLTSSLKPQAGSRKDSEESFPFNVHRASSDSMGDFSPKDSSKTLRESRDSMALEPEKKTSGSLFSLPEITMPLWKVFMFLVLAFFWDYGKEVSSFVSNVGAKDATCICPAAALEAPTGSISATDAVALLKSEGKCAKCNLALEDNTSFTGLVKSFVRSVKDIFALEAPTPAPMLEFAPKGCDAVALVSKCNQAPVETEGGLVLSLCRWLRDIVLHPLGAPSSTPGTPMLGFVSDNGSNAVALVSNHKGKTVKRKQPTVTFYASRYSFNTLLAGILLLL